MSTPYRSDAEALQARLALLEEQLAAVRVRRAELSVLQRQEASLESEIDALRHNLDGMPGRKSLRLLEDVRVASPCNVAWDAMQGNGRARFCTKCQKDVFNLSGMSREEAESFVRERAGDVCIRLHRRRDGTVLTSDCPVGRRKRARRWRAIGAFSGLVVTALFARGSLTFGRAASTLRQVGLYPRDVVEPEITETVMMGVMANRTPANAANGGSQSTGPHLTRAHVTLLDRINGDVVGSVPADEMVYVRRVAGAWVFIAYVDQDRAVSGWTLKSLVQ